MDGHEERDFTFMASVYTSGMSGEYLLASARGPLRGVMGKMGRYE